jgi:DNA-binding MarR family transcriptional regulator
MVSCLPRLAGALPVVTSCLVKVTITILPNVIIVSTEPPEYSELVELDQAPQALADESCPGADPEALAGLGETERRRALVAQTAHFATAFLRWTDGRSCGGLTYTRLRLLEALHCGGPAIMRELGVQLGVSPRNMTAMVDALEDAHLVVRRPHPTDRRATLVELSPDGIKEAEQALAPRLDAVAELFEVFSAEEQREFFATLGRLVAAMEARQEASPGHASPVSP